MEVTPEKLQAPYKRLVPQDFLITDTVIKAEVMLANSTNPIYVNDESGIVYPPLSHRLGMDEYQYALWEAENYPSLLKMNERNQAFYVSKKKSKLKIRRNTNYNNYQFLPLNGLRDQRGLPINPYAKEILLVNGGVLGWGALPFPGENPAVDPIFFRKIVIDGLVKVQFLATKRNKEQAMEGGALYGICGGGKLEVERDARNRNILSVEDNILGCLRELYEEGGIVITKDELEDNKKVENIINIYTGIAAADRRNCLNGWISTNVYLFILNDLFASELHPKAVGHHESLWKTLDSETILELFASHSSYLKAAVIALETVMTSRNGIETFIDHDGIVRQAS